MNCWLNLSDRLEITTRRVSEGLFEIPSLTRRVVMIVAAHLCPFDPELQLRSERQFQVTLHSKRIEYFLVPPTNSLVLVSNVLAIGECTMP
jgi:hypothetical protein